MLIERIVRHFATGSDLVVEEEPPAPLKEPRRLDEQQFGLLFGTLKNQELVDILRRRDGLRQSGSKDQRIATLWAAHISEVNLLSDLMNRDLEDVLNRIGLKLAGSKPERVGSERSRKSVLPNAFWYFSIMGGVTLLSYAIYQRDIVFMVGQASGLLIYARNLVLTKQHAALQDEALEC